MNVKVYHRRRHLNLAVRLSIIVSFQAGTVCGQNFSDQSARMLCQDLGYRGADSWATGLKWDIQQSYSTVLSEALCSNQTKSFSECIYKTELANSTHCGHELDVFLSCTSNNGK